MDYYFTLGSNSYNMDVTQAEIDAHSFVNKGIEVRTRAHIDYRFNETIDFYSRQPSKCDWAINNKDFLGVPDPTDSSSLWEPRVIGFDGFVLATMSSWCETEIFPMFDSNKIVASSDTIFIVGVGLADIALMGDYYPYWRADEANIKYLRIGRLEAGAPISILTNEIGVDYKLGDTELNLRNFIDGGKLITYGVTAMGAVSGLHIKIDGITGLANSTWDDELGYSLEATDLLECFPQYPRVDVSRFPPCDPRPTPVEPFKMRYDAIKLQNFGHPFNLRRGK